MLLHDLTIENFRSFEKYKLDKLARVNLLVGKNNCGKTTVLEALELLQSAGDQFTLLNGAYRRGELFVRDDDDVRVSRVYPEVAHMFHNRSMNVGASFSIRGSDGQFLAVNVVHPRDYDESQQRLFNEIRDVPPELAIVVTSDKENDRNRLLPLSPEGFVPVDIMRSGRIGREARLLSSGTTFVTADALDVRSMAAMWDRVIADSREGEVVSALKLLEPKLRDLQFKASDQAYRAGRGGVLLGVDGIQRRQPLGSYGEGMKRMLGLAIALVCSSSGMLLIDEIDTGLHYSVLAKMWELVVTTAERFQVQVFATTHSLDCIRALNSACERDESLGKEVALLSIDRRMDKAVRFDAEDLSIVVDQEIEVR